MRLPRRLQARAIKSPKGKKSKGLASFIRDIHRLYRPARKTKNPRKKFLAKIQRTKLRTFGVARAGTHMHHAAARKPKAAKSHRNHLKHRRVA